MFVLKARVDERDRSGRKMLPKSKSFPARRRRATEEAIVIFLRKLEKFEKEVAIREFDQLGAVIFDL